MIRRGDSFGLAAANRPGPVSWDEVTASVANVRVYELAKELEMSSHDLMTALAEMKIEVKSHSSALDPETVEKVKQTLGKAGGAVETKREITLPESVTVRQLAALMELTTSDVQQALIKQGALVGVNHALAPDLAKAVAQSFGYDVSVPEPKVVKQPKPKVKAEPQPKAEEAPPAEPAVEPKKEAKPAPEIPKKAKAPVRKAALVPRPPIVTILGHVDHGKTTLLDAIRKSNVIDQEFGGITQHIGAYQVEVKGKKITFLDTPGHEAFTAMRARGAQVTDIAVLIIAADDGVMPQTVEALDHARAAGVQIIVAINKVDKPDANPEKTKQQLTEHNLVVEQYGGDTVSVEISAKAQQNLDELLDMILLVAELTELKADPEGPVEATVIEAELDRGQGPVATVLVQSGTLKKGAAVIVGQTHGRIKAMLDDRGQRIQKAGPATPVEIVGLSAVPQAGDRLEVAEDEKTARQIADSRKEDERSERLASTKRVTLADLHRQLEEGVVKELNVVLKADVQGSAEAIRQSLERLSTDEVRVNLIHIGVGNIGESDILLASASNAVVIGFNVRVDNPAKRMAEAQHIDVRTYQVIYELIDEVKAAMEGLLEPILEETVLGHVEVRQLFKLPKRGMVAGCYVTDGRAQRNAQVRVMRNGEILATSKVASLRHVKEDVSEMAAGFECGVVVEGFTNFEVGDVIEFFTVEEIARRI